jgi:hypothetical protein
MSYLLLGSLARYTAASYVTSHLCNVSLAGLRKCIVYYSDLDLKIVVTRQNGSRETTIDLVLANEELAALVVSTRVRS